MKDCGISVWSGTSLRIGPPSELRRGARPCERRGSAISSAQWMAVWPLQNDLCGNDGHP